MKPAKTFIQPVNKLEILRRRIAARAQKVAHDARLSPSLTAPSAAVPPTITAQGSMS